MVKEVDNLLPAPDDVSYDTSDPVQVNQKRKKTGRTRADRLEFIKAAMQHEQGRGWFYDILSFCKIFETPYVSGDSYGTTFKVGQQNCGLRILADLQEAAPTDYMLMLKENR